MLGNLLADEYQNFDDDKNFDEDHLKSLLECLAQLHGTGSTYLTYIYSLFSFLIRCLITFLQV